MKKIVLFDIDYTLFKTDSLKQSDLTIFEPYPEVVETLKKISEKALMGIFSEGDEEFQRKKLEKVHILSYFSNDMIYIIENKFEHIQNVIQKYDKKKLFVVDDKLIILSHIKKQFPHVITIWMKRGPYAASQEKTSDYHPDYTVSELSEIIPIVS